MINCKFCHNESKQNYNGYCQSCYRYFIQENGRIFYKPKYGECLKVNIPGDKQDGMYICHICGKAFTKLQQHIYYSHHLSKKEYCNMFGIDNNYVLTTEEYHNKMRDLAYKYNMDEQVKEVGKNTRFKKGQNTGKYKRSYQTIKRLQQQGKYLAQNYNNGINNRKECK